MSASRLVAARYAVTDPEASARFYCDVLGLEPVPGQGGESGALAVRMPSAEGVEEAAQVRLEFEPANPGFPELPPPEVRGSEDAYWKIGITVPDLDAFRTRVQAHGVAVSEPRQFEDIGYLCHLHDPNGLSIELLQQTFEGSEKTSQGSPTLAHVTLRIRDLAQSIAHWCDEVGLRLVSTQRVERFGFTLYFLSEVREHPPCSEIQGNPDEVRAFREWLWQRPYTLLELFHRDGDVSGEYQSHERWSTGFRGLRLR